ncbi:MAG: T9SS type A sorting domain-containing protein [Bacteroidota bacterium]
MKKNIFLFLVSFFGYSQVYIEVKLVNPNVGYSNFDPFTSSGTTSNDAGLNAILSQNYVSQYRPKNGNPFDNSPRYTSVLCGEMYGANLLTQLQNYSTVIESAALSIEYNFNNMLTIQLITNATGIQTGTNGNIVVTNDAGLSQIFADYNIVEMVQSFPSTGNNLNRYYRIRSSNCDLQNLKTALDNYNSVIQATEFIGGDLQLNNQSFETKTTSIYPNPFQNELNIETDKTISSYEVVDISGKNIINADNKIDFNNSVSQLNNGIYFLQLNYDNSTNSTHKIIKN